jgi:hypothetical protein
LSPFKKRLYSYIIPNRKENTIVKMEKFKNILNVFYKSIFEDYYVTIAQIGRTVIGT